MKRVLLVLLLFVFAALCMLAEARAADRRYPPRYQRGSYAEYLARKKPDGKVEVRQVYSGYANRFPPPAFLYYGYPHSGDETGIGPLDRK